MLHLNIQQAAHALGGKVVSGRIRCPAPGKDKQNRSLSVALNPDGTFHVTDWTGGDWRVARDHVKARLGITDSRPLAFNDNTPRVDHRLLADERARIARGMRIWRDALPIARTPAETYLAGRGVSYTGEALRFHPSCPFRKERHPAMVALMTDAITGEPCGVHRTALLPDGAGKATPGKMMLGRAGGAVVRLSADEDVTTGLAIAEGIETALAAPFRPIWACLSAGTMAAFPVLAGIEALTIFADHDKAGIEAANACGERWHAAEREVTILAPPKAGADFADMREAA